MRAVVLILLCLKESKLLAYCEVVLLYLKLLTRIDAPTELSATSARSTTKQAAFKINLAAAGYLFY
jgi:hypothetical protein